MIADARQPPTDLNGYDPTRDAEGYFYDEVAAEKSVEFFPMALCHVKGPAALEPYVLSDWQADVNRTLFGWKRPDGSRRYRTAFIAVARKNSKTTWVAGLANYVLFTDREGGAELYCAAENREQASLLFDISAGMIEQKEALADRVKIRRSQKRIILDKYRSVFRAIPANEGGSHGFNSHFIVGDEIHAWPGREFYNVLHTSTGARTQPLELYITTAGYDRETICYELWEYSRKVRDGEVEDASFLPVIYETEEHEDWTSPEVWRKANPNLGISVAYEYIERECERAKLDPAYENAFRRLHLNQWCAQETRWLQMHDWDDCPGTEEDLNPDELVVGGLDLAAVEDFTAWSKVQWCGDGAIKVRNHYWLPERRARDYAQQGLSIDKWVRGGWLTLIPDARIDQNYIHAHIRRDAEKYNIEHIGYDPWNMEKLRADLESEGFLMEIVRQGYGGLSAPSKELQGQVINHTLDHGGDPVLRWMADNVVVKFDENENLRPIKAQRNKRIDGIVAAIMAIGVLTKEQPEGPSSYSVPGRLII